MLAPQPQCAACTHLDRQAAPSDPHCDAFPSGIPDEIWTNKVPHTDSYPGDHGIHLDLIPLDVLGQGEGAQA